MAQDGREEEAGHEGPREALPPGEVLTRATAESLCILNSQDESHKKMKVRVGQCKNESQSKNESLGTSRSKSAGVGQSTADTMLRHAVLTDAVLNFRHLYKVYGVKDTTYSMWYIQYVSYRR